MSWEIRWRCSGGLRPCRSRSSAVLTLDHDEDGGVALRCGNSGDVGRSFSHSFPSSSLVSLSWLGCAEGSHKVAAGH